MDSGSVFCQQCSMIKTFMILVAALLSFTSARADDKEDATKVATAFYKTYVSALSKSEDGEEVVKESPYLSQGFKKAYDALQKKARKEDPELGLGYDPIICGQDFPAGGFSVSKISIKDDTAAVTMKSKDKDFESVIQITMIQQDDTWLIHGIEDVKAK